MRTFLFLAIICLVTAFAWAGEIVEESSNTEFPATMTIAMDGDLEKSLHATGTGLRKKAWFKVYAACFYVEDGFELGDEPYAAAIDGDFAKSITMHFLRDVGGDKMQGAFRDGIRKTIPEGQDEVIEAFAGLFVDKVMNGETIVLDYFPGTGLVARQAGEDLGILADEGVISALWAIWFGEDPISDDMKKGLVGL
jgi:hypothetical protein